MLVDTTAYAFIKKRYQLRFITHFCVSMLVVVALAVIIFDLYINKELGGTYYQSLLTLQGVRNNIIPAMIFTGGILIIFATLAVLIITLIGSNKIAGPIYRLERSLESIGKGDLGLRIKFRKHDAIDRVAEDINSATENLNTRISTVSSNIKEIKEEAGRLRNNPHKSPAILLEKIRLVRKEVSDLKTNNPGD